MTEYVTNCTSGWAVLRLIVKKVSDCVTKREKAGQRPWLSSCSGISACFVFSFLSSQRNTGQNGGRQWLSPTPCLDPVWLYALLPAIILGRHLGFSSSRKWLPLTGNGKGFAGFHWVLLSRVSRIFLNFIPHVQLVSSYVYLTSHPQEDHSIPECACCHVLLPASWANSSCSSTGSALCRPPSRCPPHNSSMARLCVHIWHWGCSKWIYTSDICT